MSKDFMVDHWDVESRKDGDKAGHDTPEQELVLPYVVKPLRKVVLAAWRHSEEGPSHIDRGPGKKNRKPGHCDERCGAGAEDRITACGIGRITIDA